MEIKTSDASKPTSVRPKTKSGTPSWMKGPESKRRSLRLEPMKYEPTLKEELETLRHSLMPFVTRTPTRLRSVARRYVDNSVWFAQEWRKQKWKNDPQAQILCLNLQIDCIRSLVKVSRTK